MTPVEPKVLHQEDAKLVVYAQNQEQYLPLPASKSPDGTLMTEWELTKEDFDKLIHGGRVRLWIWTFNHPLQPVALEVVT